MINGVANVDFTWTDLKGNSHDTPELIEVGQDTLVAIIFVFEILEGTECSVDDGSVDGVFQSIEGIIAKKIDWRNRNNVGGGGSWNFCVLVEHCIGIGRIITIGNRLLGDDGGDVGRKGEGVVEQSGDHGRTVSGIKEQN